MRKVLILLLCFVALNAKDKIEKWGDIVQIVVPVSAATYSYVKQDYEGIALEAGTILATQLVVEGLKNAVKEKRPNYKSGDLKKSFPSGHAAGAFIGASYIHARYSFKEAIPFYILASYVGYSRVHAKKHYVHDVLAGAAIAVGGGVIIS